MKLYYDSKTGRYFYQMDKQDESQLRLEPMMRSRSGWRCRNTGLFAIFWFMLILASYLIYKWDVRVIPWYQKPVHVKGSAVEQALKSKKVLKEPDNMLDDKEFDKDYDTIGNVAEEVKTSLLISAMRTSSRGSSEQNSESEQTTIANETGEPETTLPPDSDNGKSGEERTENLSKMKEENRRRSYNKVKVGMRETLKKVTGRHKFLGEEEKEEGHLNDKEFEKEKETKDQVDQGKHEEKSRDKEEESEKEKGRKDKGPIDLVENWDKHKEEKYHKKIEDTNNDEENVKDKGKEQDQMADKEIALKDKMDIEEKQGGTEKEIDKKGDETEMKTFGKESNDTWEYNEMYQLRNSSSKEEPEKEKHKANWALELENRNKRIKEKYHKIEDTNNDEEKVKDKGKEVEEQDQVVDKEIALKDKMDIEQKKETDDNKERVGYKKKLKLREFEKQDGTEKEIDKKGNETEMKTLEKEIKEDDSDKTTTTLGPPKIMEQNRKETQIEKQGGTEKEIDKKGNAKEMKLEKEIKEDDSDKTTTTLGPPKIMEQNPKETQMRKQVQRDESGKTTTMEPLEIIDKKEKAEKKNEEESRKRFRKKRLRALEKLRNQLH